MCKLNLFALAMQVYLCMEILFFSYVQYKTAKIFILVFVCKPVIIYFRDLSPDWDLIQANNSKI